MQQLHLVGFTTDHDGLIFSARKGAKSGGFLVALDDALIDSIDEAGRRRNGDDNGDRRAARRSAPRPESALSPRDMQMRLRAGRSIANVAAEAGVDEEWVMRFAVPILAEQALIIAKAQDMTFAKARLGDSGRTLKESVWWNVADKGLLMSEDAFDQCWTAQHLRDSAWVVRFDFVNRKKRQRAEWEIDTRDAVLVARNRLASELGFVEPGRRGRPPAPLPPEAKPPPKRPAPLPRPVAKAPAAKRPAAKKAVTKKAVTRKPNAKKATTKKTAAKKTAPARRATAKRPAAKRPAAKRVAKRAPAKRTPAKRTTAKRPAAKRPAAKRPAPKRVAAKRPAAKRVAAKRPAAKRPAKRAPVKRAAAKKATARRPALKRAPTTSAARARLVEAPTQRPAVAAPMFDPGEATRPVTIRAPRAIEELTPPPRAIDAPPEEELAHEDELAPLPAPPVLTSTPRPAPAQSDSPDRRFGRLRRRRPPGN